MQELKGFPNIYKNLKKLLKVLRHSKEFSENSQSFW